MYIISKSPNLVGKSDVFPHLIYISLGLGQFKESFKIVNSRERWWKPQNDTLNNMIQILFAFTVIPQNGETIILST